MFVDATGIIVADDKRVHLSELSRPRALAAVPFAGRYRIIDFMLSNMANSGITLVGVSTFNKYKSLMDHLGTGSAYDLDRKLQGLHILPPYLTSENYYNESDDLKGLLDFISGSRHKYVIIGNSTVVFSTDFEDLYNAHENSDAEITVMYNHDGARGKETDIILETDDKGRVIDVYSNPEKPVSDKNFLGVMILSKNLMMDLISDAVSLGVSNLSMELILRKCHKININTYEYNDPVLRIGDIQDYFEASMMLLNPEVNEAIFWSKEPVYTKVKDEAPACIENRSKVHNSLLADGCHIYGRVCDSILFRGVNTGKNSEVKNSIIFQNTQIGNNVELEHVIVDKDVIIRDGTRLIGQKEYPVVIGKGAVV